MRLKGLFCNRHLDFDSIGRFFYIVEFLYFINVLVVEGVFKHFTCV